MGGLFLTQFFEPPAGAAAPAGQIELTLTAMIMHDPSDPPVADQGSIVRIDQVREWTINPLWERKNARPYTW